MNGSPPQPARPAPTWVARLAHVRHHYGKVVALADLTLDLKAGIRIGLLGPDGVGKSTLLSLIAGARVLQSGTLEVLGGDLTSVHHREAVCPRIAYMPQGLGKNLNPTLSAEENLQFFARLFGQPAAERRTRIDTLTRSTGLFPFLARPVGNLSGGMKQKLGLCCALIHDPDLLILDEPTTGVDPLARSQFWELIDHIRADRPGLSVVVATAYLDEARHFDWLVALDAGQVLATGTPAELLARTGCETLDDAFIALLPEDRRRGHQPVTLPPLATGPEAEPAIEAEGLTRRFGDFLAVDHASFRIQRGEIFGFIGSNGCGKSTTMKMLTGLLPITEGEARLFGQPIQAQDLATRRRVGYLSQNFSLYAELTVRQNLVLHAQLFEVPAAELPARLKELLQRFELTDVQDSLPDALPLGIRQRLSLAVAVVHRPELLILDEPTSGVDPIARDRLWQLMIDLARQDRVTIFISTHFMNEAARCDRVALMHAGRVLATGTPAELVSQRGAASLEAVFIDWLKEAESATPTDGTSTPAPTPLPPPAAPSPPAPVATPAPSPRPGPRWRFRFPFSFSRAWSYSVREAQELRRDPVRATLALLGTALLMVVFGYGISLDVEDLNFAVLDRDQTMLSRNYVLNLAGSRYFVERPALHDDQELDQRLRSGELALAVEIPSGFARHLQHGRPVQIGAWIDAAMPRRAETVAGYVQGMHVGWLQEVARERLGQSDAVTPYRLETRYRYNPDVRSLPAMVPAVIPMLLLMIPAMLTALSVVREKELGSILNLYVTPVTRSEFLLGKQLPYVVLGLFNFALMIGLAVTLFQVPLKGSLMALTAAAVPFVLFSTGFGLLASTFTRTQVAALFVTMIGTMIPAVQFAGMLNPISSLSGFGWVFGHAYPASHFLTISRGVFNKGLGFAGLQDSFWPLLLAVPVILGLSICLLRKQAA